MDSDDTCCNNDDTEWQRCHLMSVLTLTVIGNIRRDSMTLVTFIVTVVTLMQGNILASHEQLYQSN